MALSLEFASGSGIELAPLASAWPRHDRMNVKYVERYSHAELMKQYPDINEEHLAPIDFFEDARTLPSFKANSQDFVLHSHLLEHSDNPLRSFERWLEVLKVGGVMLGAVPNKDYTFDVDRPLTLFRDLEAAYMGSSLFKVGALYSFFKHVDKMDDQKISENIARAMDSDSHVHFPVWDFQTFANFLERAEEVIKFKYDVKSFEKSGGEMLFCLRRTA
jgi:SAM-dependent methyltransferase